MICPKCNSNVPDGTSFCDNCGANLMNQPMESVSNSQPGQTPQPTNNIPGPINEVPNQMVEPNIVQNNYQSSTNNGAKKPYGTFIAIVIVVIGLIIGVMALKNNNTKDPNTNTKESEKDNSSNVDETEEHEDTYDPGDGKAYFEETEQMKNLNLTNDSEGSLLMAIEDIFIMSDSEIYATGTILRGTINLNDEVEVVGMGLGTQTATVVGIQELRQSLGTATVGEVPGIIFKEYTKEDVKAGKIKRNQIIAAPGTVVSTKKFEAEVYLYEEELSKETVDLYTNDTRGYRFYTTSDIRGKLKRNDGGKILKRGETTKATIELEEDIAIEVGTKFIIRNGNENVGEGTVTKLN